MSQHSEHLAGFGELRSAVHRRDWEGLGQLELHTSPEALTYLHEVLVRHPVEDVSRALEWTRWTKVYEQSWVGCGPVEDARVDETLEMLHRGVRVAGVEFMRLDPAEYARLTLGWSVMALRSVLELYDRWCHATHPEDVGRFGELADAIEEFVAHPHSRRTKERTHTIMGARVIDGRSGPHALMTHCVEDVCERVVRQTLARSWHEVYGTWDPMHDWLCGFATRCCVAQAVFEHVYAARHDLAPEPQWEYAFGSLVMGPWDSRDELDAQQTHRQWKEDTLERGRHAWVLSWNTHVLSWWRARHHPETRYTPPVVPSTQRFESSWGWGYPKGVSRENCAAPGRGVVLGHTLSV